MGRRKRMSKAERGARSAAAIMRAAARLIVRQGYGKTRASSRSAWQRATAAPSSAPFGVERGPVTGAPQAHHDAFSDDQIGPTLACKKGLEALCADVDPELEAVAFLATLRGTALQWLVDHKGFDLDRVREGLVDKGSASKGPMPLRVRDGRATSQKTRSTELYLRGDDREIRSGEARHASSSGPPLSRRGGVERFGAVFPASHRASATTLPADAAALQRYLESGDALVTALRLLVRADRGTGSRADGGRCATLGSARIPPRDSGSSFSLRREQND